MRQSLRPRLPSSSLQLRMSLNFCSSCLSLSRCVPPFYAVLRTESRALCMWEEHSPKQAILPASKLNLDCDPFKTFSHKPVLQSIVLHGLLARSGGKGFGRICSGVVQRSAYTNFLSLNCSVAPFQFSATVFYRHSLCRCPCLVPDSKVDF